MKRKLCIVLLLCFVSLIWSGCASHQMKPQWEKVGTQRKQIETPESMTAVERQYELNPSTIMTRSGKTHTGTLLYATDTLLVLWRSKEPYNSRKLFDFANPYHFSEIHWIFVGRDIEVGKGDLWQGVGYGAITGLIIGGIIAPMIDDSSPGSYANFTWAMRIAAVIGLTGLGSCVGGIVGGSSGRGSSRVGGVLVGGDAEAYNRLVPRLKKNSIFSSKPPPELQTLVNEFQ